jgi:hypothetical protein
MQTSSTAIVLKANYGGNEKIGAGAVHSLLRDARIKIPVAATVVTIQAHEMRSLRALVMQARTNLAGHARLHQGVFDRGFLDGTDLWWLD